MSTDEKVVAIEYHRGHPHSVTTTSNGNGWSVWDFDWCERDQTVYYHQSGGGPAESYSVGKLGRGQRAELWVDTSVKGFTDSGSRKPLTRRQVEKYGYRLLAKPKSDPFEDAVSGSVTWCEVCKDQLPDDNSCWHLVYVPGVLSYGGDADSFALLLEAIRCGIHLDRVAFVDVGDQMRWS